MDKCARCHVRKAKRACPALGIELCPLCCGLVREKKIHCPATCPHLVQHKPYQEKRIIDRKQTSAEDVLADERLTWLLLHIEAPIADRAEKDPSFTDKEALLALEYARGKIEKEKSRLLLPREKASLGNETGEAIFESIEACRYQRKIVLPSHVADYKKEEKLKCLDKVILDLKHLAAKDWEGRNYIRELSRRFSELKALSQNRKIIRSS